MDKKSCREKKEGFLSSMLDVLSCECGMKLRPDYSYVSAVVMHYSKMSCSDFRKMCDRMIERRRKKNHMEQPSIAEWRLVQ